MLPSDIAVLVRSRDQVNLVRDALRRAGIPSVLAGGASVFQTDAAIFWQRVLAAMAQPHRPDRVRLAALTPLLGYTVTSLDEGGDALVADISSDPARSTRQRSTPPASPPCTSSSRPPRALTNGWSPSKAANEQ